MKLFLLDAYALIYRAYYAFMRIPQVNSAGMNTSAVFGFVNTLEDVLRKENPTHIGVVFDPPGGTFRHRAYPGYKSQREETPEVIRFSVPVIKDILNAYRIPVFEVSGFEADDVIGTLAVRAAVEGFRVYMMTPDKDYCQLVDRNIFVYRPRHGGNDFEVMGIEEVKLRYGIEHPGRMIDLLGLMGDKSDNIPGCPGIGEVTARKLLAEFGSVSNLLDRKDELRGVLRSRVVENVESINLSTFLATIVTDAPVEFDADMLRRRPVDDVELRRLFDGLEFRSLTKRILGDISGPVVVLPKPAERQLSLFDEMEVSAADAGGAVALSGGVSDHLDSIGTVSHHYYMLRDDDDIRRYVGQILERGTVAFDTETTGLNPLTAELVGLSFSLEAGIACYVPVPADFGGAVRVLEFFRGVFESEMVTKIGQNLKYDINVLKKYGIRVAGPLFDTMIAHYLLNPEHRHGLDYLAEVFLGYRTIHIEELIGGHGKEQLNMRFLPPERVLDYAAEDADIAFRLRGIFAKMLEEGGFSELFYGVETPLVYVLADMEEFGVGLDVRSLERSSEVLRVGLRRVESEIFSLAGTDFNINSPKLTGEILFNRLGISYVGKKTKSGNYQTGEDILERLAPRHPIAGKILSYRKMKKLLSTYTEALPELVSPLDGRIHTTYNQTGTSTGRLSSTAPNLQNIPVRDEEGREIRRAFVPLPGHLFFSADYSQVELRILAHLSGDLAMLEAFRSGFDIHAATASKIYGVKMDAVTGEMRRMAKSVNFGIVYGISAFGLSEQLGVSRASARELIDGYFATYPGIRTYIDGVLESARRLGYVETLLRRRRYLPDIISANATVRGYAERNAVNATVQGSAADVIKVAMNLIHKRFREGQLGSRMMMQVHDELNFDVLEGERDVVRDIVIDSMEHAVSLRVPLVADCGFGLNWLEAH
ncbi:MAG: DNA polymerase I [Dysgonamonadaceae bacterium]|jgi:DNA polymerase-1|nr:DNA polymerase I [Dysgonamonadaceae bacterium]